MDKFTIRDIVAEDIPAIAGYLAAKSGGVYKETDWLRILRWIWLDNPNIKDEIKQLGWAIVDSENNIAGVLGNIPVQCVAYGQVKNSFWATTWFVDEVARGQSLELFMRYVRQQGLLMSNTPNENVEKLLVKVLKYKRADSFWFKGSYLFPLKPVSGYFSENKGQANQVKKIGIPVLGSVLKIPQAFVFLSMRTSKVFKEISVKLVDDLSEKTDNWFREFSKQHSCVLMRSAETYRWIFCNPANKHLFNVFEVVYANKVQGYLVFKHKYNPGADFNYIELIDEALLELPGSVHEKVMAKAYYEINSLARKESLLIMRSNNKKVHASLRKLMGIPLKKVEKTYYRDNFLKPGDTPFLTSLDGDSIFF